MAADIKKLWAPAHDGFERYYSEKLWEWIPAIYKDEDGLAVKPEVLRSLVEILSQQAAIARRSIDRLWDDPFIELCDDWAISYIGDLLGTRLVHELNRRGRRVDVARTIFYRRRKGTPLLFELLIRDFSGWEGVVVESFRRLARSRHGLDPAPPGLEGPVTGTAPGGWAQITSVRGAELAGGPFEEFFHTPDFRQLDGKQGHYNIPKLNFHLFRLLPFELNFVTAMDLGGGRFTFDPSGRDIPLFSPDQRPEPQKWRPPRQWELPTTIPCRLLGAAQYTITAQLIDTLIDQGLLQPAADELSRYVGILFQNEARLRQTIESLDESTAILALFDALLADAITEDSPKAHLLPTPIQPDPSAVAIAVGPKIDVAPIEHQRITAANLEDWGASLGMLAPEKTLAIDPERGRFWFPTPPAKDQKVWVPVYHYGFSGKIGAGTYDRRDTIVTQGLTAIPSAGADDTDPGPVEVAVPPSPISGIFQFVDSKTYLTDGDVIGIDNVTFQAKNFERPYVKRIVPTGNEWVFEAQPKIDGEPRCLTFDGLWIGIEQEGATAGPAPCPPVATALVLDGEFDRMVIGHCTIDPGGEKARIDAGQCLAIPYVTLLIRGNVEELEINSCILGPILEDNVAGDPGTIQNLVIRDSIVHSIGPAIPALETALGHVKIERTTVLGDIKVNRLYASEVLVQGVVTVTDNQHGCFRFSAANDHPQTRLPQQYESHLFEPQIPNHFFVSRRFGNPGYVQLSATAPENIMRGGENRSEIGAFNRLINPIKRDDLNAKVIEFLPFGLIPQYINET